MLYTDPAGTYAVVDDGGGGATCPYGSRWNPSIHSCTGYGTGGGGGSGWNHDVVAGGVVPVVAPPVIEPAPIIGPGGMPFTPVMPPVTGVCIGPIFILGPGWQEYLDRQVEMIHRLAEQHRTQPQPLSQPTAPTPSEQTPTPQKMSVFKPGADMPQTTQHIIDAIAIGKPSIVTYRGPNNGHSRGWLRSTPACRGNSLTRWCDEYPFASVNEGGQANNPSLRIVPASEQRVQAGKWTGFLGACQVATDEKVKIEPSLSIPQTTWSCK